MKKLRVGVLFGGRSGEHEVSVNSANSVLNAIDPEKFEAVPIGITKAGRWLLGAHPSQVLAQGGYDSKLVAVTLIPDPTEAKLKAVSDGNAEMSSLDVIFPVLHGTYGEDGTIQGLFELANIPYVGSGVLGSAVGMDKIIMKHIFAQVGLPQARFLAFTRKQFERAPQGVLEEVEQGLGFPCFVKPANMGSSVGISKAHNRSELQRALETAAKYDRRMLVEEFVEAREIEVSVLGNDEPIASVPGEIIPCNEFYDYKAKYIDADSTLIIPADLPVDTVDTVRSAAVKAFQALDCAGLSRVDFFVTKRDGRVLINEVNTLPGFTNISMYPKLWEASGIPYSQLLGKLIELAIERHQDKNRSKTTFELED